MDNIIASDKVRYQTAVFERLEFKYGKSVSIGRVSQSWIIFGPSIRGSTIAHFRLFNFYILAGTKYRG